MNITRDDMNAEIKSVLNNMLYNMFEYEGIKTGDITPEQSIRFGALIEYLTSLLFEVAEQNAKEA